MFITLELLFHCWNCFAHWELNLIEILAQVTLMLIFSYTAFQLAEVAAMSGIVASLTAGFLGKRLMARALHDDSAREFAAQFFHLLAALSEALIFLLLGINIALFTNEFNLAFTGA